MNFFNKIFNPKKLLLLTPLFCASTENGRTLSVQSRYLIFSVCPLVGENTCFKFDIKTVLTTVIRLTTRNIQCSHPNKFDFYQKKYYKVKRLSSVESQIVKSCNLHVSQILICDICIK